MEWRVYQVRCLLCGYEMEVDARSEEEAIARPCPNFPCSEMPDAQCTGDLEVIR